MKSILMRQFRIQWRPLTRAAALSLALGVLGLPIGIAHVDARPDPCDRPMAARATGTPGMVAAATWDLDHHCFTCHWLQSFRSSLTASGTVVLDARADCLILVESSVTYERLLRQSVPARAPPA